MKSERGYAAMELILAWTKNPTEVTVRKAPTQLGEIISPSLAGHENDLGLSGPERTVEETKILFATINYLLLFLGWTFKQSAQANQGGGVTVILSSPQG